MRVPLWVLARMSLSVGPSERAITPDLKTGGMIATINTVHYNTLNYSVAQYSAFSITKKDNIEILLFYYCSPDHVYFLVLPQQSSLLSLYRP